MFENLNDKLERAFKVLKGQGQITEINVAETTKEIRKALLDADVNYKTAKDFTDRVKAKALGQNVLTSISPGQLLTKITHDELAELMGGQSAGMNMSGNPTVVLMSGLQGSGKTTFSGKLANYIRKKGKRPLLVACDVYRPAAIDQLETLGKQLDIPVFSERENKNPVSIAQNAIAHAKQHGFTAVIVDTAGRLAIDEQMMDEITRVKKAIAPHETLFVVDAMTGQDAVNTAKAFNERLNIDGVVLTKLDGDARGGAALSIRSVVDKPIKFIGTGEKADGLDVFHPDRVASRILDMGDVLSLVEQVEQQVDKDKAAKLAEKVVKGKKFDLNDMKDQLEQMQNMGGLHGLMDKLPGMGQIPDAVKNQVTGKEVLRMIAIINSMTKKERRHPDLLNGSRRARIARGAGLTPADVNRLMKQYQQMEKMMSKLSQGGMKGLMRGMKGMMGGRGGMPFR